jgi:hypothetical protein
MPKKQIRVNVAQKVVCELCRNLFTRQGYPLHRKMCGGPGAFQNPIKTGGVLTSHLRSAASVYFSLLDSAFRGTVGATTIFSQAFSFLSLIMLLFFVACAVGLVRNFLFDAVDFALALLSVLLRLFKIGRAVTVSHEAIMNKSFTGDKNGTGLIEAISHAVNLTSTMPSIADAMYETFTLKGRNTMI